MNAVQTNYARDGYLVCRELLDAATVERLRDETVAIACGRRGDIPGVVRRAHADSAALTEVLAIHLPRKVSRLLAQMVAANDYRDILMLAGHDPYQSRGLEDLARPYLRPVLGSLHGNTA